MHRVIVVKSWKTENQKWKQGVLLIFVTSFIPVLSLGSWKVLEGDRTIIYASESFSEDICRQVLEEQENALRFLEKFLNVKLNTNMKKIPIYLLSKQENFIEHFLGFARSGSVTYYEIPVEGLKNLALHELSHVVIYYLWPKGLSVTLVEGLAVALELVYVGREDRLDLLARGLIELGMKKSLVELESQDPFYYSLWGSFMVFLMREYGVEKLKEFLDARQVAVLESQEKTMEIVYGKSMEQLEKEWREFLTRHVAEKKKAVAYAKAWKLYSELLNPVLAKFRAYHNMRVAWGAPKFFGASNAEFEAWKKQGEAYLALLEDEDVEGALKRFEEALRAYVKVLETWLEAARAYQEALDLIDYGASREEVQRALEKAKKQYELVGDMEMVGEIEDLKKKILQGP